MKLEQPTTITVCDTCMLKGADQTKGVQSDGELLAESVERAAAGQAKVIVRRHSCLMGCERGCNVAIQSEGKLTYVLGRFEPGQDTALGIVDYAALHADSDTGQVAFREWPKAVKGHFVARLPAVEL